MTERKIEGVPDGWRLVAIRQVKTGEWFIGRAGHIEQRGGPRVNRCGCVTDSASVYGVIEKIEQPKKYRPFANAAEFESHREKWWRFKEDNYNLCRPPASYDDRKYWNWDWKEMFEDAVFDDGSPFGVEIT